MSTNGFQTRTFRGKSLAELLPKIRAELGADAVITRQREGLHGGFAGFFQKHFVEVEARAGGGGARTLDVYDDTADALPGDPATAEGMASPAIQALMQQAAPFAQALETAQQDLDFDEEPEAPEPSEADTSTPTDLAERPAVRRFRRTCPPQADAIEKTLIDAGLS